MRNYQDRDYFAGFTDGEGCFQIQRSNRYDTFTIEFKISLRADDVAILRSFQRVFGGNLNYESQRPLGKSPNTKPSYTWRVAAKVDILQLIEYFDEHPLAAKKKEEYVVWREAAMLYYRYSVGIAARDVGNPQWLTEAMKEYKSELERLKEYSAQPQDLTIDIDDPQLSLLGKAVNEAVEGDE